MTATKQPHKNKLKNGFQMTSIFSIENEERKYRNKTVQKLIDSGMKPEEAKELTIDIYRGIAAVLNQPIKENPSDEDIEKHLKEAFNNFDFRIRWLWEGFLDSIEERKGCGYTVRGLLMRKAGRVARKALEERC